MSAEKKAIKLSKEETLRRAADLWIRYRDRIPKELSYEQYVKEVLEEWEKQNSMDNESLKRRRRQNYREVVGTVRKEFEQENRKLDEKTKDQIILPPGMSK